MSDSPARGTRYRRSTGGTGSAPGKRGEHVERGFVGERDRVVPHGDLIEQEAAALQHPGQLGAVALPNGGERVLEGAAARQLDLFRLRACGRSGRGEVAEGELGEGVGRAHV